MGTDHDRPIRMLINGTVVADHNDILHGIRRRPLDDVVGADDGYMLHIFDVILKTGDEVVGTRPIAGTCHGVIDADDGCFLCVIGFVAAADGKGSATAFAISYSAAQCICQIFC